MMDLTFTCKNAKTLTRRHCFCLIAGSFFFAGCEAKEPAPAREKIMSSSENINMDIRVFGYVGRPIFDIFINNKDTGSVGGGGQIVGYPIKLGPQTVTWRLGGPKGMARNGETVTAKTAPVLAPPPQEARYLGVHIYPDDTVEFVYSEFLPERSERGEALRAQQRSEKK